MMDLNDDLGYIFSDALIKAVSTVSGILIDVVSEERNDELEEITGVMFISSIRNLMLFISAKESDIKVISSFMTGTPEADITTEEAEDTLCELANITSSGVKLRVHDEDRRFSISMPFIIKGKDMMISTKQRARVLSQVIGNDEISLKLVVID